MIYKYLLLAFSFVFANSVFSQSNCRNGGLIFASSNYMPESGILKQGAFSIEAIFRKKYHENYNTSFGIEFDGGIKDGVAVVNGLEFEGGYSGFSKYSQSRVELWSKMMFGKRFGNILEVTIPIKVGFRNIWFTQEYGLDPGQTIDPKDIVEGGDDENVNKIGGTKNIGFGSGVQFAFFSSYGLSPFVELTYNTFGKFENFRLTNAYLDNGLVNVPRENLKTSNDFNLRIGVRFNIGKCPKITGDIFTDEKTASRHVQLEHHEQAKKTIRHRYRRYPAQPQPNARPQQNKPAAKPSPRPGVILKPSVPKPAPKPTPNVVIPN